MYATPCGVMDDAHDDCLHIYYADDVNVFDVIGARMLMKQRDVVNSTQISASIVYRFLSPYSSMTLRNSVRVPVDHSSMDHLYIWDKQN